MGGGSPSGAPQKLLDEPRDDCILRGPRSSSFWVPRNLSHNMDNRQSRYDVTVLVMRKEMTTCMQNPITAVMAGRRVGKDDKKQNILAPFYEPK